MYGLPVGAFEEGELHLVMDANVSSPFNAFYLFYLIAFSFKRLVRGHCLGVVTSGDNVTHKHFTEMRRLARDEKAHQHYLCSLMISVYTQDS
jgi:hypothetical protein